MTPFIAHLEAEGLDPIQAAAWGEFVVGILEALIAAESSFKSKGWKEFCQAKGSFGKPRKKGCHAGRCLPDEEALSGELTDRMKEYLGDLHEDHVLRKWHVNFEGEGRVRSRKKKGKHADRTDIRAVAMQHSWLEFVLEAKVVETAGHLRSRLLGKKGLGCFTARDSYTKAAVAGLMAYVVRDGLWLERVQQAYARPPRIARTTSRVVVEPIKLELVCAPVARPSPLNPIIMLNIVLRFDTKMA